MIKWLEKLILTIASSGVVVASFFALGKGILKKYIEEKIQLANNKNLENYKNKLEEQNNKIEMLILHTAHVMETQYDREFTNYLEIWTTLQNYVEVTLNLRNKNLKPKYSFEEQNEFIQKSIKDWKESRNEYNKRIEGFAPFYQKKFYEMFIELDNECRELFNYYDGKLFNVQIADEKVKGLKSNIIEVQDMILKDLREYLQSLRIINNFNMPLNRM